MMNWLNNIWPDSLGLRIAYIVAVAVIVLFVIALVMVFRANYQSQKTLLKSKALDERLKKEIEEDKAVFAVGHKNADFVEYRAKYKANVDARDLVGRVVFIVVSVILGLGIVAGILFSNNTNSSSVSWFGDTAFVMVYDDSMENVANDNFTADSLSYLKNSDYRIQNHSLISVSKNKTAVSSLKEYQVILYTSYNAATEKTSLKLGRILNIGDGTYTVMADNETVAATVYASENGKECSLVGVYGTYSESTGQVVSGFHSLGLGALLTFFQSFAGIAAIVGIILLGSFYLYYNHKIYLCYRERYDYLLEYQTALEKANTESYCEMVWYYVDVFEKEDKLKEQEIMDKAPVRLQLKKKYPSTSTEVRNVPVTVYKLSEMHMEAKSTLKADGYVYFDTQFKKESYVLSAAGYESLPFAGYIFKGNSELFTVEDCLGTSKKNGCLYLKTDKEVPLIYVGKENEHHSLKYRMMKGTDEKRYLVIEVDAKAPVVVPEAKKNALPYGSFPKSGL